VSEIVTECVICGSPSMTRPDDPIPVVSTPHSHRLPRSMPAVDLCAEHWTAYLTDWILLGWCPGGHYAEALRTCPVHRQVVPPL
jgi:hypothetical protein